MFASHRRFFRGLIVELAALVVLAIASSASAQIKIVDKDAKQGGDTNGGTPGTFVPVAEAQDCVYDLARQRLYVTTHKQLVLVDMKDQKIIDSIDLLGNLQGMDISPDGKFLAIAPIGGQFIYKLKLDWKTPDKMEFDRIKFKADGMEPGVFALVVGADHSVLFSTTFSGSGWVKLRRLNPDDSVTDIRQIRMNSVIAVSGDRKKAYIGEGNISSGPLVQYDFKTKTASNVADLQCFYYALACSRDGSLLARPHRSGCDLLDGKGTKLGNLEGAAVIGAVFNPKTDALYILRHGSANIQRYNAGGKLMSNSYSLNNPAVINRDVRSSIVADVRPIGPNAASVDLRRVTNVNIKDYQSSRLHVTDDGKWLCAVTPEGAYVFPVDDSKEQGEQSSSSASTPSKVKINDK